jgi:hypothetical protein
MDAKINPRISIPRNLITGNLFQGTLLKMVWLKIKTPRNNFIYFLN